MSTLTAKTRLAALTKQLFAVWDQTRTTWTDEKAREFDQRYMVELQAEVENCLTAIHDLEKLIQRMKEDCE